MNEGHGVIGVALDRMYDSIDLQFITCGPCRGSGWFQYDHAVESICFECQGSGVVPYYYVGKGRHTHLISRALANKKGAWTTGVRR